MTSKGFTQSTLIQRYTVERPNYNILTTKAVINRKHEIAKKAYASKEKSSTMF